MKRWNLEENDSTFISPQVNLLQLSVNALVLRMRRQEFKRSDNVWAGTDSAFSTQYFAVVSDILTRLTSHSPNSYISLSFAEYRSI